MCKPKTPDMSVQNAEAARQSAIQEQQYQQTLAAQQAEWERQRADSEARYQQQLQLQQAETSRQLKLQTDQQAATEAQRQQEVAQQQQSATLGRSYTNIRDQLLTNAQKGVNDAYAGFDDNYFKSFADQYVAANRGTIDLNHETDTRAAKYKLADNHNLNSSAAADVFGEIDKGTNTRLSQVASQGSAAAQAYQQQINGQKLGAMNSVYALGNTAAPTFTSEGDYSTAVQSLAKNLDGMSAQIKSGVARPPGGF